MHFCLSSHPTHPPSRLPIHAHTTCPPTSLPTLSPATQATNQPTDWPTAILACHLLSGGPRQLGGGRGPREVAWSQEVGQRPRLRIQPQRCANAHTLLL
eukprot:1076866-Pleurochrysis_carterae.AAC.2